MQYPFIFLSLPSIQNLELNVAGEGAPVSLESQNWLWTTSRVLIDTPFSLLRYMSFWVVMMFIHVPGQRRRNVE